MTSINDLDACIFHTSKMSEWHCTGINKKNSKNLNSNQNTKLSGLVKSCVDNRQYKS